MSPFFSVSSRTWSRSVMVAVSTLPLEISEMATLVSISSGAPAPEIRLEPTKTKMTARAIQKKGPRMIRLKFTSSRYYDPMRGVALHSPLCPRRKGQKAWT